MKNSLASSPHTGKGIVVDVGTGDGRFVSASARAEPNKFFIGIDANVKPLEKPSMKATRKPAQGGLPNLMFVQAAAEDLPSEFDAIADEIHIHFPWGSLLQLVTVADPQLVSALRRMAADDGLLEIVIGIDPERDRSEIERLGIPELNQHYISEILTTRYKAMGFRFIEHRTLDPAEWAAIETSWAKKLSGSSARNVLFMLFQAV